MTVHPSPLDQPVEAPWRGLRSRIPVLRGRLVGTVAGLVGVALAVPLVFLPTYSVSVPQGLTPGSNFPQFQQSFWSWGRIADTTPGVESQFDYWNKASLALLVGSLVVGLAACVVYAVRRGSDGRILGAVGVVWVTAQVVSGLFGRLGEMSGDFFGSEDFTFEVYLGGRLEVLSVLALAVAVGAIAWRPLVALARAMWARAGWAQEASAWVVRQARRASQSDAPDEQEPDGPPPRVGIATIRDARPTYDQPGWHATDGVGFSDDPTSDPDRFRPPR
jgi:hypothetical protein